MPGEEGADEVGTWLLKGSIGEARKARSEAWVVLCIYPFPFELRASRAGEVRGVKYSPGIVYSGRQNWVSNGVTAGDIKGVKALYNTN